MRLYFWLNLLNTKHMLQRPMHLNWVLPRKESLVNLQWVHCLSHRMVRLGNQTKQKTCRSNSFKHNSILRVVMQSSKTVIRKKNWRQVIHSLLTVVMQQLLCCSQIMVMQRLTQSSLKDLQTQPDITVSLVQVLTEVTLLHTLTGSD